MRSSVRARLIATVGCLAVLGGLLFTSTAAASPAGYTKAEFQRDLDALQQQGVTGLQGRIITESGQQWTATSGVADLDTGRPVSANGYYRIGSNTKTFVATVVLQLVAADRLALEDTVERWLPGLVTGNGNDGSKITVRQLLQHTSGLFDYVQKLPGGEENRFRHYEPTELVALAVGQPPHFAPGTGWYYSNTGYALLGMIIEKVTHRPWRTEITQRILDPLHLKHTFLPGDFPWMPNPHAKGYQQYLPGGPLKDETVQNQTWAGSAGEITSTTADLSRFFRALLAGRLLEPAQLAEMRRTVPTTWGGVRLGYGLGLFENKLSCGGSYWSHGGQGAGYTSLEGFSADGRRSIAISVTGPHGKTVADYPKLQAAAEKLVDNLFCK